MTKALRRFAVPSALGVLVVGFLLLRTPSEARKDAVAAARRYALRQRTGEAEFGKPLSLGEPVSTEARDRWTCVVFAAVDQQARVGVLLTSGSSGWEGWFARASRRADLDCKAMLDEARTLNTNQAPYIQ